MYLEHPPLAFKVKSKLAGRDFGTHDLPSPTPNRKLELNENLTKSDGESSFDDKRG